MKATSSCAAGLLPPTASGRPLGRKASYGVALAGLSAQPGDARRAEAEFKRNARNCSSGS